MDPILLIPTHSPFILRSPTTRWLCSRLANEESASWGEKLRPPHIKMAWVDLKINIYRLWGNCCQVGGAPDLFVWIIYGKICSFVPLPPSLLMCRVIWINIFGFLSGEQTAGTVFFFFLAVGHRPRFYLFVIICIWTSCEFRFWYPESLQFFLYACGVEIKKSSFEKMGHPMRNSITSYINLLSCYIFKKNT